MKRSSTRWLDYQSEPAQSVPSPEELQATLEERVQARISRGEFTEENVRYIAQLKLPLSRSGLDVSDEVLEKLRRLCQLWNVRLLPQEKITSHRPLIGPVIVAVKKAIFPIVRYILKDVLHQQRSFNAAAIQLLAEIASDSNTQPHSKSLESAPGQSSSKRIVQ